MGNVLLFKLGDGYMGVHYIIFISLFNKIQQKYSRSLTGILGGGLATFKDTDDKTNSGGD